MCDKEEPEYRQMDTESPTVADVLVAARLTHVHCPNPYAKIYAQNVPVSLLHYGEIGMRDQIEYVLANLGNWRTKTAIECKAVFRKWLILNPAT